MPLRNTLRCLIGQEKNPDKMPTFYEALTDIWRPIQTRCDFFEDELEMLECLAKKKPEAATLSASESEQRGSGSSLQRNLLI